MKWFIALLFVFLPSLCFANGSLSITGIAPVGTINGTAPTVMIFVQNENGLITYVACDDDGDNAYTAAGDSIHVVGSDGTPSGTCNDIYFTTTELDSDDGDGTGVFFLTIAETSASNLPNGTYKFYFYSSGATTVDAGIASFKQEF